MTTHAAITQKRAAQEAGIPATWHLSPDTLSNAPKDALTTIRTCDILTPQELAWTETSSLSELLSHLAQRKVSSVQLTTAFCKRAAVAQQLTRCLTEIFFNRALERARELDEYLEANGKVVGPLHGLPVSIKDRFDIEGVDSTVGWVGLIDKPALQSSSLIQVLESMGAVLYVKTNIPQSLMMSDSYNHVFGQSVNSLNRELISGGSSGGEGALIAAGGSVVGIGTDIGGSIRIPANLQGLYSITPTTGRIPWDCSFMHQHYLVPPVAGPMGRSIATIESFMETFLSSQPWTVDPGCIPIPWRKELAAPPPPGKKLKLGFVFDDGVVRPQPPIARALRETAAKLVEAGHEVFEWDTSLHTPGTKLWTKAVLADGGKHCRDLCKLVGEPLIDGMVVGSDADLLSIPEREELESQKWTYQTTYLAQWQTSAVDAVILPITPWVGYRPKTWVRSSQWLGYTAVFNLLNYAAVTVPVGRADAVRDAPGNEPGWEGHVPRNEADGFNWRQYDVDLVKDMPVCVQIVGGRFGEEKAVGVAKVVDKAMKGGK